MNEKSDPKDSRGWREGAEACLFSLNFTRCELSRTFNSSTTRAMTTLIVEKESRK
jgi:hypothetical protein